MVASKDNIKKWLCISLVIGCISLLPIACSGESLLSGFAINRHGSFVSPKGGHEALLEINGMGGFLTLNIISISDKRRSKAIDDVTGIVWISENKLLYTVSPIYGIPGIFVFDCRKMKMKRILGPKTFYKENPRGADFFELKEFLKEKIFFYYSPDVNSTDFEEFRTKKYLYQINLDGTEFKKAQDK
jgi:hypothetical protein